MKTHINYCSLFTRLTVVSALTMIGQGTSFAQEAATTTLEEIVVTARQRAETLQDVPISETVFTARQIEDANIGKAGDFIAMTPNVTLAESQSAGVSFMTIRGISQVRNGEPPVATVVDGVLQINSRQFTQELFDVEQIEVLRGPQGALYGRNATGGAILINTKQPTNETEGFVRLGLGEGNETSLQGSVSGAIIEDTLMYRVAGSYTDRDGYFNNNFLGVEADPYEDTTLRGLLKWEVSDVLSADLRVNISHTETGAINFQYQPALFDPAMPCFTNGALAFIGAADADSVSRDFCATNAGIGERDIAELSLKLDYDLGFATLSSVSSWNEVEEYVAGDNFPYTAALTLFGGNLDGTQTQFVDVSAWSQELRLTSNSDSALSWMLGAYYLETDRFISTTTGIDNGQGVVRLEGAPQFNNASNPTATFLADDNNNTAWAVFGSLNYNVSENLELALALRYDNDEREQSVSPFSTSGVAGAENRAEFDKLQPKVSLRYRIGEDAQAYASWGSGFRSGQFNQNGVGVAAATVGVIGVNDIVAQEETDTFELGFKGEFFDNSMRLNGSLFRTVVDGSQYFVFVGALGAQVLVNIDEVELTGGEIEVLASLGEGLDIYGGIGYTDSEITRYGLNPAAVGNEAPYVPGSTFNLGGQYRFPVTSSLNGFVRVDYEHRGAQFWDPENTTDRSSIDLVGARLGVEAISGKWSLIASVDNATDEIYNSEWVLGGFAHPAAPRVWSVDFKYNF